MAVAAAKISGMNRIVNLANSKEYSCKFTRIPLAVNIRLGEDFTEGSHAPKFVLARFVKFRCLACLTCCQVAFM